MTDKAICFFNSIHSSTFGISDLIAGQATTEKRRRDLFTATSSNTEIYGNIFGEATRIAGATKEQSQLRFIGQNSGRLIYRRDAWDARAADKARGRFKSHKKDYTAELSLQFEKAILSFDGIPSLPGNCQERINEIFVGTPSRHRELIPPKMVAPTGEKRSKKEYKRKED